MSKLTYILSAGRNIGSGTIKLSHDNWQRLQRELDTVVHANNGRIISQSLGFGFYEGVKEDCVTFIFQTASPAADELTLRDCVRLTKRLSYIAACYGQDSFALTSGITSFIKR